MEDVQPMLHRSVHNPNAAAESAARKSRSRGASPAGRRGSRTASNKKEMEERTIDSSDFYAEYHGVQEQINNIHATGACFEAGIQYITGKRDNFHFGITLRNVGTNMRFSGDGFSGSFDNTNNTNASYTINRYTPAEKFEMPTYLNFGVSYDFYFDEGRMSGDSGAVPKHKLTVMGNFTSNSFNNDYLGGGLEYSFHNMFMIRGAYRYEKNIGDAALATTFYTGYSFGGTVKVPVSSKGQKMAIDYSYRPTQRPANGVHTVSLRFML